MLLEFLALSAIALYLCYRWAVVNNDFFEKRGIPYEKPFPLLGSMKDVIFRKTSMFERVLDIYRTHDGKVFGAFDQRVPMLVIRDTEIIKSITIKDFDHFVNHRSIFGDNDGTNLFGSSLFMMVDSKWKDMRSTLSPVFTGSKMRHMFQLINKVAQDTVMYMNRESAVRTKNGMDTDLKDYFTRFTNDIIASAAFGLEVNSFENRNNQFYVMGKKVTTFTAWMNIKFFLYANFKTIMKAFKISLFDKEQENYFMRLVLDAIKYRKEHNIIRPDMINLLMEARGIIQSDNQKSHNREWNDTEIVAQCFLFFFAGFDTASVLMCMAVQELMENPDIQQRLYDEIQQVAEQLDGKPLTYEVLQDMKYLDMVVSETLRKWPAAIAIDRQCSKDYVYETSDGYRVEVKKGENIWIPIVGLHRDPKYYDNPDKFEPERFSEENKGNIEPFAYMPFGMGPRNCIGSRFALLEAKALIYYFVRDFNIVPSKKSTIPMELTKKSFQLMPKNGYWVKLISRSVN